MSTRAGSRQERQARQLDNAIPPPRSRSARLATGLPWLLAAAVVGAQVAYPLTADEHRGALSVGTVVLFFVASVSHAAVHRGVGWAAALVLVFGGGGLAVEMVGVRTGYPFGEYAYTGALGWELAGVPLAIPLAWTMMAYPALVVAHRLVRRNVALVAAFALTSWDVFLDPQMVAAGHWRWADPEPSLPGVDGVPLTNFAGWLVVSVLLMTVLDRLRWRDMPDGMPGALYLWTYASSVLAAAAFFDRPGVAVVGGLLMGAVAVPYAYLRWQDRR